MTTALEGLNVVEWGTGRMSAYAAKLLCDYGASVTLLAGPRRDGELYGRLPACEAEAMRCFLDEGKVSRSFDPHEDDAPLQDLLDNADVLLFEQDVRAAETLGLAPEDLARRHPELVVVAISYGGLTPAGRYLRHADIVALATGGLALRTPPLAERTPAQPPLKLGGYQADYATGLTAATAALSGIQKRRRTAAGSLQDVSAQAVIASFLRYEAAFHLYNHLPAPQRIVRTTFASLVPCKDGFFAFQVSEQYQWDGLKHMMGDPDWADDERFNVITDGVEHWAEFEPGFLAWTMEHSKQEIFTLGQSLRVPVFPLNTVAELLDDPQQEARHFFRDIELPESGRTARLPGAMLHFERTPARGDTASMWPETSPNEEGSS